MNCEECGRKWFGQIFSNVSSCDWWTEESNEILHYSIVGGPSQELKWAFPEYKSEVLAYESACPVTMKKREMK